MEVVAKKLIVKKDSRGWLAEILRPEDLVSKKFGQIIVTVAKPGQTKGNHYHKRKIEWYCVLSGIGEVSLIDNKTGEKKKVKIGKRNMAVVKIPPHIFHSIKNTSQEDMCLMVYVSEAFNPDDPDTYYEPPKTK